MAKLTLSMMEFSEAFDLVSAIADTMHETGVRRLLEDSKFDHGEIAKKLASEWKYASYDEVNRVIIIELPQAKVMNSLKSVKSLSKTVGKVIPMLMGVWELYLGACEKAGNEFKAIWK
jgi:hypothetical protein